MSKWDMVKLSDMFTLQMGKTPSRDNPDYWNGNRKWVSISDLGKNSKYIYNTKECITDIAVSETGIKITPKDTVIMSFKLSIGKTAITVEDIYTNEAIMSFIDNGIYKFDLDYIYYLFNGKDWNEGTNKAVMGITLNKATLSQIKIPLPPLEIQKQIAENLDKVTRTIDLCHTILEKLDLLVKARFVEMFGDPVANPKKWDTKLFLDIGKCKNGMNFHYDDSGVEVHCLGVGDFKDLSIINDTSILPKISLNEMPTEEYLLQNGDIVFVRSNGNKALVGRSLAIYPNDIPTTFSGFCIRFRKENNSILISYLLRVLKTDSIRKKMAGRGANIQNLNQQILSTLEIPVPPLNLQEQFAHFVEQTDKLKSAVYRVLEKAEILKKALMQEYFG